MLTSFCQVSLGAVLSLKLPLDFFGLHHLLDLGQTEAEELLEALDLLDAADVILRVETEAAFHPARGLEEAFLLVEAESALGDAGALGDLAYL